MPKKLSGISSLPFKINNSLKFGTYYTNDQNLAVLPVHPLVHIQHISYVDIRAEFLNSVDAKGGGVLDVFDFERSPIFALQNIGRG